MTTEAKTKSSSLVSRLSRVMAAVSRLPKRGFNEHYRYAYATSEDVLDLLRGAIAAEGVVFIPSMLSCESKTAPSGRGVIVTIQWAMKFLAEGETIEALWFSEASDTQDKGINKAATAAVKYYLLKTFLVSTGDEPDADADAPLPPAGDAPPKAAPKNGPKLTTPEQIQSMRSVVAEMGRDWDAYLGYVVGKMKRSLELLTTAEAADLLAELRMMAAQWESSGA